MIGDARTEKHRLCKPGEWVWYSGVYRLYGPNGKRTDFTRRVERASKFPPGLAPGYRYKYERES